ncbi:MAG: divergent polysaccharide deacetylase family protein [Hyphomicrobiales bacterium]|nr:divergent polysaccharide deacetylase family protein [Hyphomicrobiales bacterium]
MALPIVVFAGWAMLNSDPFGGEPLAVAPVSVETAAGEADAPPAPAPAGAPPATNPNNTKTVTIIDGTSGTRREVVIPGTPDSPPASAEQRLSESSRHGPLPRIAPDGTRPSEAFARPVNVPAGRANAPRIALVVAGLGISATATADALRKLPGPVTLAFAPYGGDLEHQVARARESGHEVMLQVPMEPLDFPDNDPGPHTLLTSLDAAQNIDRLHWLMSRFQGYVGIVNAMGGRFSASEQAMSSVLREAATRGLLFLDDGSSPRSLASQIAGANNIAFAKADLILDQVPTPAEIDRALGRIETIARTRGTAVAIAGALPVSIDRIARFVKAVESRGILLVPITAVVARARPS